MVVWMIICYFIYQHESVVKDLRRPHDDMAVMAGGETVEESVSDTVGAKINELFAVDRIYLNPRLKLSDIVRMAGSNRTYVASGSIATRSRPFMTMSTISVSSMLALFCGIQPTVSP